MFTKFRALTILASLYVYILFSLHFFGLIPGNATVEYCNYYGAPQQSASYGILLYPVAAVSAFFDCHNWLITAVATLVIAWFTWKLRDSTEKLWSAGERQLKLSRKTGKRELRAYIGVDETPDEEGRNLSVSHLKVQARIYIKNFGKTPAYQVKMSAIVEYLPFPHEDGFSFPEIEYEGKGIIQPEQDAILVAESRHDYANKTIADSMIDTKKLQNGALRWHIFGYVTYRDAFGEQHYSRFCWWLSWDNGNAKCPGWYNCHSETDDKFSS